MDVEKERARNSSGRQKGASRLRSWRLRFCIGALFLCAFPFLFFGLYDGDAIASLGIFGSSYDCKGKWIYMYDLSPRFNVALLKECSWLDKDKGKSPCQRYDNRGLGPESDYGFSRGGPAIGVGTGWYQTSDSSLEQYFYERFQDYPCRTVQ